MVPKLVIALIATLACSSLLAGAEDASKANSNEGELTTAHLGKRPSKKYSAPKCKCTDHENNKCFARKGKYSAIPLEPPPPDTPWTPTETTPVAATSYYHHGNGGSSSSSRSCSCSKCGTPPANADAVCQDGSCTFVCRPGYLNCGKACIYCPSKPGAKIGCDAATSTCKYTAAGLTTIEGGIQPASNDVLQASYLAAQLANLSYPVGDVADADTNPADDQRFQQQLKGQLASLGLTYVGNVSRYSTPGFRSSTRFLQSYIAAKSGTAAAVYVVFRGTDFSIPSVGTNLLSAQVDLPKNPGAGVHEGYYKSLTESPGWLYNSVQVSTSAFSDIKGQINAALTQLGSNPKPTINVVGHSLGGAEAALCAYLLKTEGTYDNKINLLTFGMPQVGNQTWREDFDKQLGGAHYRWWNEDDPVPQFPNRQVDPGNAVGIVLNEYQSWFTLDALFRINWVGDYPNSVLKCGIPSGAYAVCDATPSVQPPTNSESCFNAALDLDTIWGVPAHSILTYIANLKTCMSSA